jgi:hypothetical protein
MCQNVAIELGLPDIDMVVSATGKNEKKLLKFLLRTGEDIKLRLEWPQLRKTHTITMVDGQANYALPADFDTVVHNTHWDRANQWPLIGPLTMQEWRARQEGVSTAGIRARFIVRGYAEKEFYVDPTPGSTEAGNILVFDYQSDIWILPEQWAASTAYTDDQFVSYDGNIYQADGAGTSGATAPTHTSGSDTDGAVTWDYYSSAYTTPTKDTDFSVLDEETIELGMMWRFLRSNRLPYEDYYKEFEDRVYDQVGTRKGARKLNLSVGRVGRRLIGYENMPDTGYG